MGYTLRIGNARLEGEWDNQYGESIARWYVDGLSLDEAPLFSDSGRSNTRSPSYSQWANFCRALDIEHMMLNKDDGLIRTHPGCVPLKQEHLDLVRERTEAYKREHPGKQARYCQCPTCDPYRNRGPDTMPPPHDPDADEMLVRAEWLIWWMQWALDTCERPAFYNS